ncbi:MAG: rsmH [Chlamydiales bacterium]|jgi:16S rRNA (cytosine1402-N4)-methyltransferase|nr:rsmH [Chlamydiales bacterium]
MTFHHSVLKEEFLQAYEGRSIRYFLDATLGAGGHSAAILEAHPEIELLVGLDQDPMAIEIAKERLAPFQGKVQILCTNFSGMEEALQPLDASGKYGSKLCFDGIFFDLGVSSMQLDFAHRGFSFMRDGPLDMRMDPTNPLTAEIIVNDWPERELGLVLARYGEIKDWRQTARTICQAREKERIVSTLQLARLMPAFRKKGKEIHPATLAFQALRIAVNEELSVAATALPLAIDRLTVGGRLGVISFHSLEDRIAKNIFKEGCSDKLDTGSSIVGLFLDKEPILKAVTRKPLTASLEEVAQNPRSRSAKLRFVEKLA